jgi:outer membrane immunogenic protein
VEATVGNPVIWQVPVSSRPFAGGLSAKVEYNYVRTPNVETTSALGKSETDIGSHELKAGLNYRF